MIQQIIFTLVKFDITLVKVEFTLVNSQFWVFLLINVTCNLFFQYWQAETIHNQLWLVSENHFYTCKIWFYTCKSLFHTCKSTIFRNGNQGCDIQNMIQDITVRYLHQT